MKNDTLLRVFMAILFILMVASISLHLIPPPAQEAVEFKLCCPAEVCYLATVISQTDWLNIQDENAESYPVLDKRCSHNLDEVRRYAEHHRGHKHHVIITKLARTKGGVSFEGIDNE